MTERRNLSQGAIWQSGAVDFCKCGGLIHRDGKCTMNCKKPTKKTEKK
jgi:hypothetical protein